MRLHRLVALASWLSQAFDVRNLNISPIAPHWSWPSKSRAGKVRHAAARSMTCGRGEGRRRMSALMRITDSSRTLRHVRKVPTTDIQADLGGLILHSQQRGRARNSSKIEGSGS